MGGINYISKGHHSYPEYSGGYIKVDIYLMWTGSLKQSTSTDACFKVLNLCVKGIDQPLARSEATLMMKGN